MTPTSAAALIAFGAFSLAAQTVMLREYMVGCNGGELAVGLFYASWFLWIAAGATLHRRLPRASGGAVRRLLLLLALYAPAAVVQLVALRSMRALADVPAADVFPLGALVWVTIVANLPLGVITGLAFPSACAAVARDADAPDRAATRGYVLESAGSFAGGLGVTLAWLTATTPVTTLAVAVSGLGAAATALALRHRQAGLAAVLAAEAALGLVVWSTPLGDRLEQAAEDARFAHALPGVERVESLDTPYRHMAIGRRGDQRIALSDGTLLAALPSRDSDLPTAALLMAQVPTARHVLLVGQGAEGLAAELLAYSPRRLVHLQPDTRAAEALARHLPADLARALSEPALDPMVGDPRIELAGALRAGDPFDLVVLDLGDPTTASANRLATVEFYELCRGVLADDGVLATHFTATVNYLGDETASYGASVLATLRAVFDDVALIPGETTWLLAGASTIPTADPAELVRRYHALPPSSRAVPDQTFANLVDPRRVETAKASYEGALERGGDWLRNRDEAPVSYFLELRVMAHTTGSELASALGGLRRGGVWLAVIPLLVAAAIRLRRAALWPDGADEERRAGTLLLAAAGAAAIALQVCLILSFQVRFGDLYLQVGWLNALFMAGLAAGGLAGRRATPGSGLRTAIEFCVTAAVFAAVASEGMERLQVLEGAWVQPAYYVLIASGGVVFGRGFPVAGGLVAASAPGPARVGALLESADHWGAAAGAALVGVALVPLLGPSRTALLLAFAMSTLAATLALPIAWRATARMWPWLGRRLAAAEVIGRGRSASWRGTSGWLLGGALVAVLVSAVVRAGSDGPRIRFDDDELARMSADAGWAERSRPFLHYRGTDRRGELAGDVVCSSIAVTDEIHGYGGPLNLLLAFEPDGTIRDLRLVSSRETPAYLVGFDGWLGRLRDLPLETPIDPAAGAPIEIVTGATVTSVAALATVERVRRDVARRILDLSPPPAARQPSPLARLPVLVLLCLFVAAVPTLLSGRRWLRTALLILVAVVAGAWLNLQLSLEHIAFLARLELPPLSNAEVALLLGGALALGVAFGPAYCGVLCPFGAVQELAAGAGWTRRPTEHADRVLRGLKYLVLVVALVLLLVTGSHSWLAFDPLAARFGLRAGGPLLALVVLALLASLRYRRFWCRYLCPAGAALALTNRLALLRRWLPRRRYDRCDLGVASAGDWDCIQCNRCGWTAPTTALADHPPRDTGRREESWLLALAVAVSLALGVWVVGASRIPSVETAGATRPVDVEEVRRQIESRQLSDHPAEFWEGVE